MWWWAFRNPKDALRGRTQFTGIGLNLILITLQIFRGIAIQHTYTRHAEQMQGWIDAEWAEYL